MTFIDWKWQILAIFKICIWNICLIFSVLYHCKLSTCRCFDSLGKQCSLCSGSMLEEWYKTTELIMKIQLIYKRCGLSGIKTLTISVSNVAASGTCDANCHFLSFVKTLCHSAFHHHYTWPLFSKLCTSRRRLNNTARTKSDKFHIKTNTTLMLSGFIGVMTASVFSWQYALELFSVSSKAWETRKSSVPQSSADCCGFGTLVVLLYNIGVVHDGKQVQHYDSQPNSTGQPVPYSPSPVMSIEIALTRDDQSFLSVVMFAFPQVAALIVDQVKTSVRTKVESFPESRLLIMMCCNCRSLGQANYQIEVRAGSPGPLCFGNNWHY